MAPALVAAFWRYGEGILTRMPPSRVCARERSRLGESGSGWPEETVGAAGVVVAGSGVQAIFGTKSGNAKAKWLGTSVTAKQ